MTSASPSRAPPSGCAESPERARTTASGYNSVFEIEVDPAQWTARKARLGSTIDPKHDSLLPWQLGTN
ncbi:CRISPR-associated endonuclease Cas2 [Bradyrhizobium sp. SZCCHNRI3037]|uniref:CRISPR-associated endonuclease Cas2 n=1 Tax=Bradyrhizobium sp. SZCCHNRI3037 TaxID=3057290 RepID=UPI00396794DE